MHATILILQPNDTVEPKARVVMASSIPMHKGLQLSCCMQRSSNLESALRQTTNLKPMLRRLQEFNVGIELDSVSKSMKNTSIKLLDAVADSMFQFIDQPFVPGQGNLVPVDELKESVLLSSIEGEIPHDFPTGVYIRNGPNPTFGGLKSTVSMFGRTSHIWVEGDGMLHALYFVKSAGDVDDGAARWSVVYKNKQVETDSLTIEQQRKKPSFLPAAEGNTAAVIVAAFLNLLRYGRVTKRISNTNVFEHGGKFYSTAENDIPQEIDIFTLETFANWDINGTWRRPFTSHPKRAPGTGELVIMGVRPIKPFMELGVISADGKGLVHKVDLKFNRCSFGHELGVTQRYNVITDFPLTMDIFRVLRGGQLFKYDKEDYARIGVMPRYGDAESIQWFDVKTCCTFHFLNFFEDDNEVVVRGCRTHDSVIPGPEVGDDKVEWFRRRSKPLLESEEEHESTQHESLFTRCYEWRLNMETGEVKERYLTGTDFSMDFPMINDDFTSVRNKYGYTLLVDFDSSCSAATGKFGGIAKLHFDEPDADNSDLVKVEYHKFEKNTFCSGAKFVPKPGGTEEDDGWIITHVHNEDTDISQVYIIDTKDFCSKPAAKIGLPCRVPYGFHGAFMPIPLHNL